MNKAYKLTDKQIRGMAIIATREQGTSEAGIKACVSHMLNYYEIWGKKYANPYDCLIKSGWYGVESFNLDWIAKHNSVSSKVIGYVSEVLAGKRTIPDYCDEYDCLSDVKTATNNGRSFPPEDRSQYKQDVTVIKNRYDSTYTFYCFPDGAGGQCDAFGYTCKKPKAPTTTPTTTSIPDKACKWAEGIAADQSHGYSQQNRWGPDYDCSSMVISAYKKAGVPIDTSKVYYTGNMNGLKNYGFKEVTASCNLNTGSGLKRGDILYYHISGTNGHTAMYCGNGRIVHARGQSYGSPTTGDQGSEIAVTSYSRSKWQHVLRYGKGGTATPAASRSNVFYGCTGRDVLECQKLLSAKGYKGGNGKPLDLDGECGTNTTWAIRMFQSDNGLMVDGICGKKTWKALMK